MSSEVKPVYIHPLGICDSPNVGSGTRIWAFAHVMSGAVIGKHCNVGEHSFVENEVVIGDGCTIKNGVAVWDCITLEDDVFVGPYAVFTNDFRPRAFIKRGKKYYRPTLLKKGATIGANATIVCGVTLGQYCFVAAGTVVTQDVPDHGLIVGNPGRIIGRVCYCGFRLTTDDYCEDCKTPLSKNSLDKVKARF